MAIKKIRLKNFQIHSDLTVIPGDGVTVIVGQTDSGKSSVFRALRWLVEHRPIGAYAKFGTKDTSVEVATEANVVQRFRRTGANGYQINDGPELVAVGTNQPLAVRQCLQLDAINLQGQHDAPFLLGLTAGEMARELNSIVDLGVIDRANAEAKKVIKKLQDEHTAYETLQASWDDKAAKLAWAEDAQNQLESLAVQEQRLISEKQRATQLSRAFHAIESTREPLERLRAAEAILGPLVAQAKEIAEKKARRTRLRHLASLASDAARKTNALRAAQDALVGIVSAAKEISDAKTKRESLRSKLAAVAKCEQRLRVVAAANAVDYNWAVISEKHARRKELQKALKSWQQVDEMRGRIKELSDQEAEIRETTPTCPTCGKPLT